MSVLSPKLTYYVLFWGIISLSSFIAAEPKQGKADYSRTRILPLVSKPGKDRNLFSSIPKNQPAVWNKKFWGASLGFDQFTGIAWQTPQAGTLITPQHVVCATHYGINHQGFHFYGADGSYLGNILPDRNAENVIFSLKINPDIQIIRLATPAPTGARIYPLPDPSSYQQRLKWSALPIEQRPILIATDWRNPRPKKTDDPKERQKWKTTRSAHPVSLANINEQNRSMQWALGKQGDASVHPSYHETVNKGDSSHPIFWLTPSGLVLASTFTGVTGGPDYGNPDIQRELQAAIDKLGGKNPYKIKTVPVP